jgi:hypothetical protein
MLCERNNSTDPEIDCIRIVLYKGKSISKLQIAIEKKQREIMIYEQHLFFNIISIQV